MGATSFLHLNRLFVLAGDQMTWWYSKSFQDDIGAAPGFHPDFRLVFDTAQTCGGSMDAYAVFYSPTGIRYMTGVGPAKDGTSNDFLVPTKIQTDVGCTNPRSLVNTPDGQMFLSAKGIMLLSRGLDVSWIGKPIQDTLVLFPNITSAVLVPNRDEVRFTAMSSDSTRGITFVYNYVRAQWSTLKHFQGLNGGNGVPIYDALLWNGVWTLATSVGIFTESSTANTDAGTYVPGIVETAWISNAGPNTYQSIRSFEMHGITNSDHDLLIEMTVDDQGYGKKSRLFRAGVGPTSTSDPFEQFKIYGGSMQKNNTCRFRITDTAPSTPGLPLPSVSGGKGPSWSTMSIDVAIKGGDNIGATRKG